ncbi:IS1595 family transposase [Paenibacillus soyae]|uniref:IS1595 family transposase n=1 Tax=Paenibacillus soyae TaxID=2969249 RepID=A0A9X2S819_9BACL|nr:IS1595 family transposase [Paenibacillus soyae]MCR2803750.1 IS1595 family transposase [Paenibacillus soyae]
MVLQAFIDQFEQKFMNEESCIAAVENWKWPDGFRCPHCPSREAYRIANRRLPLFECVRCGAQTSLTSGTMMHKTSTPLRKWLLAMYLVSCDKAALNAKKLSGVLEVSYKTAWRMLHLIRVAISESDSGQLLQGKIEAKHEVFMRQLMPTDDNLSKERSVIIAKGRNSEGATYFKIKRIDRNVQSRTALLAEEKKDFQDRYCDAISSDLQLNVRSQQIRKISASMLNKKKTVNGNGNAYQQQVQRPFYPLSIIASEAFQWINDQFHGIGPKYAQLYLDEFCFRLNRKLDDPLTSMSWLIKRMSDYSTTAAEWLSEAQTKTSSEVFFKQAS